MRIAVVAIGSPRDSALAALIREYESRASRYFSFDVIEVPGVRGGSLNPDEVRRREGEALLAKTPVRLARFAVTRIGRSMSSSELATRLGEMGTYGLPGAAFIIGGAHGLDEAVLEAAEERLSLSAFTFPHEIARLVLAEQIYRAGTINRGEPYHKGVSA